ncbi:hypothetical protein A9168_01810 [Macellibacteroides sp. HH-ZS]|nr:hypothetical protein A9168_01810 [Macellibacteroides sp. HH-ZS]
MKKLVFVTTIPISFHFFKGQLHYLKDYFDVFAISSQKAELKEIGEREGVEVIPIPMARPISLWKDIKSLILFVYTFLKLKPDIVHGSTPKGGFLSMIAAWGTRVPVRIYMCHGLRYQGTSGLLRQVLITAERITCACASHVLCVSKGVWETLKTDRICIGKPTVVLNGSSNGIDLDYYRRSKVTNRARLMRKYHITSSNFVFCFIGRVAQDKGMNELLEAFQHLSRKYSHLRLLIVGNEEKEDPVSEQARLIMELSPYIYFAGFQKDIRPYLSISDALLLPSYREGFGMVLMEAAAMGVPSIASDIIGCNNVLIEGENGLFVRPHDVASLVEAMERIYTDKTLRDHIRNVTRRSIAARFEQKMVWQAYLNNYLRLQPQ